MSFLGCYRIFCDIKDSVELSMPCVCFPHLIKERLRCFDQVCGHDGTIVPTTERTIRKKLSATGDIEVSAYGKLMQDIARPLVPKFYKEVRLKSGNFMEIENLCQHFDNPAIMDIKMGTRTFLESEVTNPSKRTDLYEKMVQLDPSEPTREEHSDKAVTKLRYMQYRERESTSASLGFRIEAVKMPNKCLRRDFKKVNSRRQVTDIIDTFLPKSAAMKAQLNKRLRLMRDIIQESPVFKSHEVVGSSFLIMHDKHQIGVWIIDFAKFAELPDGINIDHRSAWEIGNHEDGYLLGVDNLIEIVEEMELEKPASTLLTNGVLSTEVSVESS